jgi:cytochrome c biogenesis protein CcmG/thiol:disulfide interchange protein DsbE
MMKTIGTRWIWLILLGTALALQACGSQTETMPGIVLPSLDGQLVNLSDLNGKVVMLNFWATWCPPCRSEIPDFVELENELGSRGLAIIGVSLDTDTPDQVKAFVKENAINYQVLYAGDQSEEVVDQMGGIRGIPTTFLIDRQGGIVRKVTGVLSKQDWIKAVSDLL